MNLILFYGQNPLISPLLNYHHLVKETLCFEPINQKKCLKEIGKRIIAIALFPIAYMGLIVGAAIGALLHPIFKRKWGVKTQELQKGIRTIGEWIEEGMQKVPTKRYNWKTSYIHSSLASMELYARGASQAFIASSGILSNFQQVPFQDPISQKWVKSAAHLFQAYKFPLKERFKVFTLSTPQEALDYAKTHLPNRYKTYWASCSLHLMVYIQLAKALEAKTGLKEHLLETKDAFIIEDTSARRSTAFPERYWGDNGDGSGNNQLGWAQMKARDFIREHEKTKTFNADTVKDYFAIHVKKALESYLAQVYTTDPS